MPLIVVAGWRYPDATGILNSLRSSKELGQSNFLNPGTILYGAGVDLDVLPELRLFANINHISFAQNAIVETVRNQPLSSKSIG